MNKFAKVFHDSYQCRKLIKIGVGFLIISLVLFAIPLGSLFADTRLDWGQNGSGLLRIFQDASKVTGTGYSHQEVMQPS